MRLRYKIRLALPILVLLFTARAYSQSIVAGPATPILPSIEAGSVTVSASQELAPMAAPLGEVLSYQNESLPVIPVLGGGDYGSFITLAVGERITLATESGVLDSVAFVLDTVIGTPLILSIFPDTVIETSPGTPFHLINVFDQNTPPYFQAQLPGAALGLHQWLTVRFTQGVNVPKNFFVVLQPSVVNNQIQSVFSLRGDVQADRPSTIDNSRSAALVFVKQTSQIVSTIFDRLLVNSSTSEPIITNFYVKAFVTTSTSSVAKTSASAIKLAASQNPFNASTELQLIGVPQSELSSARVQLFDALGREVSSMSPRSNTLKISGSMLPVGQYTAVLQTSTGRASLPLMVIR